MLDLARVQRREGHRVRVLTLGNVDGKMAPEFRSVAPLDAVPKRAHGIDPVLPFRLARWFREHHVDVVHTHNELPLIYGAPGGRLARKAVVHSKHGIVPVSRGAHALRRAAARATDVFVAVSQATADVARELHECAPDKLRVVINGTNLRRFPGPPAARATIRAALGIPNDARVLVTVGRLVREKNHVHLLRSAAPLLGDKRRLVLVGDGALRAEIEAEIAKLGLAPVVHLTGGRSDVPELLAAADGWVLSSDSEGLPIGLLEAWAAGLPVVATAVGGIPAALEAEKTGILVPAGDEVALRGALERLFAGGADIDRLAAAGRAHVQATYSAEQMASAYESLYEACLRR